MKGGRFSGRLYSTVAREFTPCEEDNKVKEIQASSLLFCSECGQGNTTSSTTTEQQGQQQHKATQKATSPKSVGREWQRDPRLDTQLLLEWLPKAKDTTLYPKP